MKKKIQYAVLLALLAVLAAWNLQLFLGSGTPVPDAGLVSADDGEEVVIGSVRIPDAELRLDLLHRKRSTVASGSVRNIFAYRLAPAVAAAAPAREAAPPGEVEAGEPEEAAGAAASIPPAPYRYFGLAEGITDSDRRVFLIDGSGIYSASQGGLVDKRYRVVQIGKESLELEDTRAGHRWVLRLEFDPAKGGPPPDDAKKPQPRGLRAPRKRQ